MAEKAQVRIEHDSMGEVQVPAWAYWGAQTQRAVHNFGVSGYRFGRRFVRALGLVKKAAAEVNRDLGRLDPELAGAIIRAASEGAAGKFDEHFVVDVFQTGSGTSTNMNANEVIANRAIELLGGRVGTKQPVHPNDHVNMGQSSNDVFPTAVHVAAAESLKYDLVPSLERLRGALERKASEFHDIIKIGRTHLMDATPVRLGQEFGGYAAQIAKAVDRANRAVDALCELPIGGTAVGTGINTHPEFGRRVAARLAEETGIPFREAADHFEAQAARDGLVEASGLLRTIAVSLAKIANDIRWMASGPRCGLGELILPALQPGSSIMPGKVNPVMCEMLIQVACQVTGADLAISLGGKEGYFELNVAMPLIAHNFLESVRLLTNAVRAFAERCVDGLRANRQRCEQFVELSLALCTALAPIVGYDRAAEIAKKAYETGRTVRKICIEQDVLPREKLDEVLDPRRMLEPR